MLLAQMTGELFMNNQKTLLISLLVFIILGCNPQNKITEDQAKSVLNSFFTALNVKNYNCEELGELVTDDFMIYEMEKTFTLNQFCEFVDGARVNMKSTDWVLSDFTVSTDFNSVHIYYRNKGRFVSVDEEGQEIIINKEWLESVYIVRDNGVLKIKFLFSDDINQ